MSAREPCRTWDGGETYATLDIALRSAVLVRSLVEVLEITFASNDSAHGTNVETEEATTNNGDRRDGVHVPDLEHLVVVLETRRYASEVGVLASGSECGRGTKDWVSEKEGCGGVWAGAMSFMESSLGKRRVKVEARSRVVSRGPSARDSR